ncbi:Glycerophosphoryl diester phosphodiesterase precursor [Thalassoglobus neptunius]|uniref:glycerophosphodiester phosphodiesterase n=2 Tax=Thalassoglobus neptunius TaxID=1938619 RepID=A0A5C5X2C6_9PLAN|nr:Glycerophosphoryl diester phosphodiesterase precursor [Thalassoglobus neptunius]
MARVRQVQVIAHRGASGYLPEHTLEAKAMAYAMGADYLEQDVVLSKDNIPVVLHDIHLDTVTDVAERFPDRKRSDGRFYAIDFLAEEIQSLRASERFHHKTGKAIFSGRFPPHTGTFQVPTLADEIELIQGLNKSTGRNVAIYPELKQPEFHHEEGRDLSKVVLDELARFGYTSKSSPVIVQCFDEMELRRVREDLNCELTLVQLFSAAKWMTQRDAVDERRKRLAVVAEYADGIGPSIDAIFLEDPLGGVPISSSLVVDAHAADLIVHPWTFRADAFPSMFQSFAQLHQAAVLAGIDGVFSDFPDQSVMYFENLAAEKGRCTRMAEATAP